MAIKETTLTKGQIRKLNALRKSVGVKLGEDAFGKWLKEQAKAKAVPKVQSDPVAEKILNAVKSLEKDKTVKLGNRGYVVKRAKGKGAKGFVVQKNVK
ncbi:MAG: hypothetical protein HOO19_18940 [Rhodospirillaceae bacterium]|nr:hypothetical protein [Rhodospirillaceae bacterium]MBT4751416.1 hypothetical protein [Rhodospirillaceae bacterium]